MKLTILEWSGIKPIKITSVGPVRGSSREQREKWRQKINVYARNIYSLQKKTALCAVFLCGL
jgi:hypothetical protein